MGGHSDAGQERAKEGVDANHVGDEGAGEDKDHHGGHDSLARRGGFERHVAKPARHSGLYPEEHHGDKEQDQNDGENRGGHAARLNDGYDKGQDGPGGDVVGGGAGESGAAEGGLGQTAFFEDAGEHREGGDAHRDANKERKREKGGAGRREADRKSTRLNSSHL